MGARAGSSACMRVHADARAWGGQPEGVWGGQPMTSCGQCFNIFQVFSPFLSCVLLLGALALSFAFVTRWRHALRSAE